jgi:lysophospholipase L1-like esterase
MNARTRSIVRIAPLSLILILVSSLPAQAAADAPIRLGGGERIVFFGDSITRAGRYIDYVGAYLMTRFPDKRFTLLNRGLSGETISGTSESAERSRPNALDRFARDVAACDPDVVVACFGMNDGNYRPFDEERFARFQEGVRKLIARTRLETHARLVLLTPPPFDPYRRIAGDPDATDFGYNYPAIDYDRTLERYSRWLVSLRAEGVAVVDVHEALSEHLRRRREEKVSFFLSADAVHPGATGHWLMAQGLLRAWNAPAEAGELRIDATAHRGDHGEVRATWLAPLPLPFDPEWDGASIALEQVSELLSRYRLTAAGLPSARYRLFARAAGDGSETMVGEFSRESLEQGLDLNALESFPTVARSRHVLAALQRYHQTAYDRWRQEMDRPSGSSSRPPGATGEAEDPALAVIRRSCRPVEVRLRLVPVPTR